MESRKWSRYLSYIDGTLTAESYISLLEDARVFEQLNENYNENSFIFQQDGAPAHLAQMTLDKLVSRTTLLIGWPPNSPDLSPIEQIWAIIKKRISSYETFPKTKEELRDAVLREWNNISQETIDTLVMSFEERARICLKRAGQSISQYLSKNMKLDRVPPLPIGYPYPPLFNDGDDAELLTFYDWHKRQWKLISHLMDHRFDPQVVKYRILSLLTSQRQATYFLPASVLEERTEQNDNHIPQEEEDTLDTRSNRPIIQFNFEIRKHNEISDTEDLSNDPYKDDENIFLDSSDDDILLTSE